MTQFTVVIPTYMSSGVVGAAIQSLNDQEYKDFEVIFVDDCSPDYDKLCDVITSSADFTHKCLQLTSHVNQVKSRKVGVEAARGRFVCFLDHDDRWDRDKLLVLSSLVNSEEGDKRIYYHPVRCQYEDGSEFIYPDRGITEAETVSSYLFANNGMMQSSSLTIPTKFARSLEFNEDAVPHDDWDLVLRAEKAGARFQFLNVPMATWSVRRMIGKSARDQASVSIKWLSSRTELFDRSGTVGFYVNVVFPKLIVEKKPILALLLLLQSFSLGPIHATKSVLKLAKRWKAKRGLKA